MLGSNQKQKKSVKAVIWITRSEIKLLESARLQEEA